MGLYEIKKGTVFGLRTVLGQSGLRGGVMYYRCKCICGQVKAVSIHALLRGLSQGCRSCTQSRRTDDRGQATRREKERLDG